MTSSEVPNVAKRRGASDTSAHHAAMFTWSTGHVTVRDLVARHAPTIVRVATAHRLDSQPHKFNFQEGKLYLVRSVKYQQLVVARTPDDCYVTIPRDCPLAFRLVNSDDTLATAALTLANILGSSDLGDEGRWKGQRLQLYGTEVYRYGTVIPTEACGRLELTDLYTEKFLLCHAFAGGTLSSNLTLIPGYLPLKLNTARSMTSGTDLGVYLSHLSLAAGEFSIEYNFNDPQEIVSFSEPPNANYQPPDNQEWLESLPVSRPDLNPAPMFIPSKLDHSVSLGEVQVTSTTSNHTKPSGGRLSLNNIFAKRPLPPIPQQESKNAQPGRNDSRYKKQESSPRGSSKWQSRFKGPKSKPLTRAGSEPNLFQEANSERKLSASHSLEFLDIEDSPKETVRTKAEKSRPTAEKAFMSLPRPMRRSPAAVAASGNQEGYSSFGTRTATSRDEKPAAPAKRQRPPPPPRPSAEEIVNNFCARSKQDSSPRRQRHASPGMKRHSGTHQPSRHAEPTDSITRPGYRDTEENINPMQLAANSIPVPRVRRPANVAATLASDLQNSEEGIYDVIRSPTYLAMNRGSADSSVDKTSQPYSADTVRGPAELLDDAAYMNARELEKNSSATAHHRRPPKPPEKSSKKQTSLFPDDDEEGYCMPRGVFDDTERGQGVGAEDRNPYKVPPSQTSSLAGSQSATAIYLYPSSPPLSSPGSPDRTGYLSLDDVPTDVSGLSVEDVLQCLGWLNLDAYVEKFRSEQIDGELLMSVDQQVLIEELGFKRFDAIKLEKFARYGWRPKMARAPPSQPHVYYQQQQQQQQQQNKLCLQPEPLYTDV